MIRMIAAIDRQRGIAKHGVQPWYIPDDENYFSQQTKLYGANILVGSTTFKMFKGPLPQRNNFVLTSKNDELEGAEIVHNLESFLSKFRLKQDIWIIGGAHLYDQVMKLGLADELFLTRIDADFKCDRFFPEFDNDYGLKQKTKRQQENGFSFSYDVYMMSASSF